MSAKGIDVLLAQIIANIYQNTANDIDGDTLQDQLVDAVDSLNQSLYNNLLPYIIGQSVIIDDGGIKRLYICVTNTTPGESPITTPAKWDLISTSPTLQEVLDVGSSASGITSFSVGTTASASINVVSGNIYAAVTVSVAGSGLEYVNSSSLSQIISLSNSGIEVTDEIDEKGFVYVADYSANYTARSLPDKAYVDSYFTGALTDGAPTNAEIVGILGSAASRGAGYQASIKDTTGTGLIYKVICDGTNYYYISATQAV